MTFLQIGEITLVGEEYEDLASHIVSFSMFHNGFCVGAISSVKPKGWTATLFI